MRRQGPSWALTAGAVTCGRARRNTVRLHAGLLARRTSDPRRFEAVVLHELGHVGGSDVGFTHTAVALWRAFFFMVLLPCLSFEGWLFASGHPHDPTGVLGPEQRPSFHEVAFAIAVTVLARLTQADLLRHRELCADRLAVRWGAAPDVWADAASGTAGPSRRRGAEERLWRDSLGGYFVLPWSSHPGRGLRHRSLAKPWNGRVTASLLAAGTLACLYRMAPALDGVSPFRGDTTGVRLPVAVRCFDWFLGVLIAISFLGGMYAVLHLRVDLRLPENTSALWSGAVARLRPGRKPEPSHGASPLADADVAFLLRRLADSPRDGPPGPRALGAWLDEGMARRHAVPRREGRRAEAPDPYRRLDALAMRAWLDRDNAESRSVRDWLDQDDGRGHAVREWLDHGGDSGEALRRRLSSGAADAIETLMRAAVDVVDAPAVSPRTCEPLLRALSAVEAADHRLEAFPDEEGARHWSGVLRSARAGHRAAYLGETREARRSCAEAEDHYRTLYRRYAVIPDLAAALPAPPPPALRRT
ncbi:M48 family metalloprotease [Streptomyces sp. 8L]|uniref:M48 family metalloprotease n=1 Tax=Streptomyces sp. 8L TaxID=2877242 RepID=UPI001CD46F19|nr:M48 family metalloprotease [Streptomyces sp. 8L]MCA1221552.1 M48 family metallopeptidase [Streptomyces sp. 8L]